MSTFRDDVQALVARNEALERELVEAREKLRTAERQRDEANATAKSPATRELATVRSPVVQTAERLPLAPSLDEPAASRALFVAAHASALVLAASGPLIGIMAPRAWPSLLLMVACAVVTSVMHLRSKGSKPKNGRVYYALMAILGLVPIGGFFTPLPCAFVFAEYEKRSAVPYAITALALCSMQVWFMLGWRNV